MEEKNTTKVVNFFIYIVSFSGILHSVSVCEKCSNHMDSYGHFDGHAILLLTFYVYACVQYHSFNFFVNLGIPFLYFLTKPVTRVFFYTNSLIMFD